MIAGDATVLLVLSWVTMVPALAMAQPAPSSQQAILTLYVNESPRGEVFVYLDGADVLVEAKDLRDAGLAAAAGKSRELGGKEYLSLVSLDPPVRFAVDEKAMSLRVGVDPRILPLTRIDLGTRGPPADMVLGNDTSLFLNYAAHLNGLTGYDGYLESGLGGGAWLLYSSALVNDAAGPARGLTNLTVDDREHLRRLVIGDVVAAGDSLGGSALVGGVQLARSFDLDPYQVYRPTLGQTGVVSVPSTAEIYLNGMLVRREELPPGPFTAGGLPATSGAGDTRIIIRDALGREQTFSSSYYVPVSLLAPDVSEYGYTLGFRRGPVGRDSWGYGDPVLLAHHRLGLTSWLTGGLRVEAGLRLLSAGPNLTLGLPIGELGLSAALSIDGSGTGGAASLTYSYNGRRLSVGLFSRLLTPGYSTVSLAAADDRALLEVGGSLGMPLGARVSLAAQASGTEMRDHGASHRVSLTSAISVTREVQLNLSAIQSGGGGQAEEVAGYMGLTMVLGARTTLAASQTVGDPGSETTLDVQRTLPVVAGYGYRVHGELGAELRGDALVQAQSDYGRYSAQLAWDGQRARSVLGVAGGFVLLGGRVFATRPVQQGFALIRVPGVAGVRGYLDNQEVGRTDAQGDLIVPNLLPYYANRIGISDVDLPMDYSVPGLERQVAARNRGGVVVSFATRQIRLLRGVIVVGGGERSPAYGEMRVDAGGTDAVSPVGSDGQFELEGLPPGRHVARVDYRGGSCTIAFQVPDGNRPIEELGRVPCVARQDARR